MHRGRNRKNVLLRGWPLSCIRLGYDTEFSGKLLQVTHIIKSAMPHYIPLFRNFIEEASRNYSLVLGSISQKLSMQDIFFSNPILQKLASLLAPMSVLLQG